MIVLAEAHIYCMYQIHYWTKFLFEDRVSNIIFIAHNVSVQSLGPSMMFLLSLFINVVTYGAIYETFQPQLKKTRIYSEKFLIFYQKKFFLFQKSTLKTLLLLFWEM